MANPQSNTNAIYGVETHGRVILVDPNEVAASDKDGLNRMPETEELTPYVELYCIRRKETVITLGEDGKFSINETNATTKVNMLNMDIDTKQNTTLYTEDIVGTNGRVNNEGFGIESIDISMGANFNPLVAITFRDIRGTTLFAGGDKSPLAAIFDFPPPIYKLRIKGAYGRFVEYDLHMIDHNGANTEASGDYTLKCNFVGQYFGPVTDILLGWLKAVPVLRGDSKGIQIGDTSSTSVINGVSTNVNSFFELVNRGELLYTAVDNYTRQGSKVSEVKQISKVNEQIATIRKVFEKLGENQNPDFSAHLRANKREGWFSKVIVKAKPTDQCSFSFTFQRDTINNLNQNDGSITEFINSDTSPVNQLIRLIKSFVNSAIKNLQETNKVIGTETERPIRIDYSNQSLVKQTETNNEKEDYSLEINFLGLNNDLENILRSNLSSEVAVKTQMENDLHQITDTTLGLTPTIGNIFEVICNDFDYLMDAIRKAGDKPKTATSGATNYQVNGNVAWPYVQVSEEIRGRGQATSNIPKRQTVLVYPGKNPEFRSWPEVRLVEEYCVALTELEKASQQYNNFKKAIDSSKYVPLSPLEGTNQQTIFTNPYLGKVKSLPELYGQVLSRYVLTRDYSYGQLFDVQEDLPYQTNSRWYNRSPMFNQEQRKEIIKSLAKAEAHNVAYVAQGNETITNALLVSSNTTIEAVRGYTRQLSSNLLRYQPTPYKSYPFFSETLYNRKNSGFSGINAIVDKPSDRYRSFYEPKVTDSSDSQDAEREQLVAKLGTSIFSSDTTNQAKVNGANTLLYTDVKALSKPGKSDFIDESTDFGFFKVGFTDKDNYDLYERIAMSALIDSTTNLKKTTLDEYGADFKIVTYDINNIAESRRKFFSLIDDEGVFINLHKGLLNGRADILAKFLTPGVVEAPRMFAMQLGYQFADKIVGTDPQNFVSARDRAKFAAYYRSDDTLDFSQLIQDINGMWADLGRFVKADKVTIVDGISAKTLFTEMANKMRNMPSMQRLVETAYIINNSSMTFLNSEFIAPNMDGFRTLVDANGNFTDDTLRFYLDIFHAELRTILKDVTKSSQDAIQEIQGKIKDDDFKANIYYNFKSVYDRWIVGTQGYKPGELFQRFKFVTRSHQNIAQDCMIDFHSLIDDAKNPDMSVYTAIGRLLQENNFMFYPLHSYMEYDGNGGDFDNWRRSWQVDNHLTTTNISKPAFVCMYMGGQSSQAESISSDYGDDGFTFQDKLPEDFSSGEGYLYAFRARIGGQNQSIFGFPDWSMEEFKATDVSLKMESELLDKDTSSQKIRKSQNLMNIYQQRSYNVGMNIPLGNMCIQPTQYFQLEGMPFLGGAYMVHEVTHSISASTNRLETKFKGYRMGRFIHRILTDYLLSYTGLSGEISQTLSDFNSNPANAGALQAVNVGGGKHLSDQQIYELCKIYGYDYVLVKAFLKTETDGTGGYNKDGTIKIQFEPKYFTKKQIKNGIEGQKAEYLAFNEAAAIDLTMAQSATSYGLGQIMGFNHRAAGYPTVGAMVAAFNESEFNQLKGMLEFIKSYKPMHNAFKALDFDNICKFYNGKKYKKYGYDVKLAKAYEYCKSQPIPQPNGNFNFATGDRTFKVTRQTYSDNSTIGALTLGGEFICYVLEDKVRAQGEPTVYGKTAITAGLYPVDITYSPKFKRLMPEITKVPHQRGIRMHEGSTADDSLGCLILGTKKGTDKVQGSREAYEKLYSIMNEIKSRGDGKMFILVQDSPHEA